MLWPAQTGFQLIGNARKNEKKKREKEREREKRLRLMDVHLKERADGTNADPRNPLNRHPTELQFTSLRQSQQERLTDERMREWDREQMSDEHIAVWFVKSMHGFRSIRNWSSTAIWS
ncbi:uncharacterized protein V6R79_015421 [Siganus canaliculatus]